MLFRNNLLLSSGLHSTKKEHFWVFSTESEKEYSNKQGASKCITKTSKTEVGNDVKLSVIFTVLTVFSIVSIELNVNKIIMTKSKQINYSDFINFTDFNYSDKY